MKTGDLVIVNYPEIFHLRDKRSWSALDDVYVEPDEVSLIVDIDLNRICILNTRCQIGWSFSTWFKKVY